MLVNVQPLITLLIQSRCNRGWLVSLCVFSVIILTQVISLNAKIATIEQSRSIDWFVYDGNFGV